MTPHISARKGEIAKRVIITGDPLRAKSIAENWLTETKIVSEVRGNPIYTGTTAKGLKLSVMSSGMGMGSMSIYSEELYRFYEVSEIIRIGTLGSYQKEVVVGDTVIAISSTSDSNRNRVIFQGMDYAPTAGTGMLFRAMKGYYLIPGVHFGIIHSSESFYQEEGLNRALCLAKGGVLGVEMETACLYTTAKRYHREALSILLVSDSVIEEKAPSLTPKERETQVEKNVNIAFTVFQEK